MMTTNLETLPRGLSFVNRSASKDGFDFYPTPPWATRALFESGFQLHRNETVWEPSAGLGDMVRTIGEYHPADKIIATDIQHTPSIDFLASSNNHNADWIITNPPFNIINEYVLHALEITNRGVGMFVRYPFLETQKRYNMIFKHYKPAKIYQFYERVRLSPDVVSRKGPSAVVYVWVIWDSQHNGPTEYQWVEKSSKELEIFGDYIEDK